MVDVMQFRCGGCGRTYTGEQMRKAYESGGCVCGDNGSWMRIPNEQLFPIRCAWCGVVIQWGTVENSHGICTECRDKMLKQPDKESVR